MAKKSKKNRRPTDLRDLERRVARLEEQVATADADPVAVDGAGDPTDERLWMLAGLKSRVPAPGGVIFAGTVDLPRGGHVDWQWGTPASALLDDTWEDAAERLDALAHPVRIELLRHVLQGVRTTAALTDLDVVGTSGQLYHHLRPLLAAGWLRQAARGRYEVPADRVVPLLVVLSATKG